MGIASVILQQVSAAASGDELERLVTGPEHAEAHYRRRKMRQLGLPQITLHCLRYAAQAAAALEGLAQRGRQEAGTRQECLVASCRRCEVRQLARHSALSSA